MTTWFVTRHAGAIDWAHRHGIVSPSADRDGERIVDSIAADDVRLGDRVIGTLPVHLAAEICARGGRYFHIAMTVPSGRRGQEMSADDMDEFGASCREFVVLGSPEPSSGRTADAPAGTGEGCHVCLVSDQQFANLLPILKRRPAHVELVCTPEMLHAGKGLDRLARSLEHYGYAAGQVTPHAAPADCATDFHAARRFANRLREKLLHAHPGKAITLNATGGTKALSSAFLLEFQGLEILYTDTQRGGFIRHMENSARPAEPLGNLITSIGDYLHCQGYRISRSASDDDRWRQTANARRVISEKFAGGLGSREMSQLIGELNRRAQQVQDGICASAGRKLAQAERTALLEAKVPRMALKSLDHSRFLVDELLGAGLLTRNESDGKFFFSSLDALRYLGGGWLEEWAWFVAGECGAEDCRCGVFVQFGEGRDPAARDDNELDLVVLHHNRLLIAECKTINWYGANAKQDVLNKLDALGNHARGLFGRSLLVSARPLDDDARRRARAYGVKVLEASGLRGLKNEIRNWMAS